jgi:uncharacterized protein (DUF1499 family)
MLRGRVLLVLIVCLLALPLVVVLLQVDDFGRDFTTNVAETSWSAADAALRPIAMDRPTNEIVTAIKEAVTTLPRWTIVAEERDSGLAVLRFVRTSGLFRFKDDITVLVEDERSRRVISATSRSRVGKGDLGQNPRNLRALMGAVRQRLGLEAT